MNLLRSLLPLRHLESSVTHALLDLVVYFFGAFDSFDLHDFVLLLKILNHWHTGFHERLEPFLDTLCIVIRSTTGLASVDEALGHNILRAIEKQNELGRADSFLEANGLIHHAWEAYVIISIM